MGYIKGVAQSYAQAYCEVKAGKDSAATFTASVMDKPQNDALVHYGKADGQPVERLRHVYALALGEGMRESSGNPTEGPDASVPAAKQTAETAEAGLFQVSHDSFGNSKWLARLFTQFKADPALCHRATYLEGVKDKQRAVVGAGAGADFQQFTKDCPAFATAYAAVMFRVNKRHFGPIVRKEAELLPACVSMLQAVEMEADAACP